MKSMIIVIIGIMLLTMQQAEARDRFPCLNMHASCEGKPHAHCESYQVEKCISIIRTEVKRETVMCGHIVGAHYYCDMKDPDHGMLPNPYPTTPLSMCAEQSHMKCMHDAREQCVCYPFYNEHPEGPWTCVYVCG